MSYWLDDGILKAAVGNFVIEKWVVTNDKEDLLLFIS